MTLTSKSGWKWCAKCWQFRRDALYRKKQRLTLCEECLGKMRKLYIPKYSGSLESHDKYVVWPELNPFHLRDTRMRDMS